MVQMSAISERTKRGNGEHIDAIKRLVQNMRCNAANERARHAQPQQRYSIDFALSFASLDETKFSQNESKHRVAKRKKNVRMRSKKARTISYINHNYCSTNSRQHISTNEPLYKICLDRPETSESGESSPLRLSHDPTRN